MKIQVHVKESVITINCGDGGQSIRWLAQAALIKYDPNYMMTTGQPKGVRADGNSVISMSEIIKNVLQEGSHVWVILGQQATENTAPSKKK